MMLNLDHLAKVMYARFLHCKIIIFPFTINKYLGVETLRIFKYSISPQPFTYFLA